MIEGETKAPLTEKKREKPTDEWHLTRMPWSHNEAARGGK